MAGLRRHKRSGSAAAVTNFFGLFACRPGLNLMIAQPRHKNVRDRLTQQP